MDTKYSLTTDEAHVMLEAVKAEAIRRNLTVCIAIADQGGYLLLFERVGAMPHAADVAIRKASTAARIGQSTKFMEEHMHKRPEQAVFFQDRLAISGGLPVSYKGQCAGSIAVSGIRVRPVGSIGYTGLTQDIKAGVDQLATALDIEEVLANIGIAALGLTDEDRRAP